MHLLDEPEAVLSPSRQLQFLVLLDRYVRRGAQLVIATHSPLIMARRRNTSSMYHPSQFVIATHSPLIMAYPDAAILLVGPEGPRQVPYKNTEHYQVARRS